MTKFCSYCNVRSLDDILVNHKGINNADRSFNNDKGQTEQVSLVINKLGKKVYCLYNSTTNECQKIKRCPKCGNLLLDSLNQRLQEL